MKIEEEYADVLQNIETAILAVFRDDPRLVDREVLAGVVALADTYARELRGRSVKTPGPPGRARKIYEGCRRMCEWRLGRMPLNDDEPLEDDPEPGDLSVSEVILCLKRLRKSIRLWHAEGGPRGYLHFVRGFHFDPADVLADEGQSGPSRGQ